MTAIPKPRSRERFSEIATRHQVVTLQSRDGLVEGRSDNEASSVLLGVMSTHRNVRDE